MKKADMAVLALAGVAAYMILSKKSSAGFRIYNTQEVLDAAGNAFTNGWRYFNDGTSIGPDGAYYYQGQKVYTP